MDWSSNVEQFFRQLSEVQKAAFNNWNDTMPSMENVNTQFSDTVEKTLNFQEELIKNSLETQALIARMSIEIQQQLWNGYFQTIRKSQTQKSE
ncbi:hypothetical protein [Gloeocapsopsis sp. IPPAS B-1203]|uniref:hypothetical protein n=1 Tax=Gloeocapsopsis sp. IPPAS B-1203 TaxID=2049454 RepID=UPI000C186394|nr:hypothetical protein [Gloeocapsopsis sp. IPPAS B-1203]PIG92205.1 hypothetical protein CSQ79_16340 [Gloeocapsopsis sp. IPPAS B-1203]